MGKVHHLANIHTFHENTEAPELRRSRYCNFNLYSAFSPSAASANKLSSQGNPVWKDNPFLIMWTDTFCNEMAQGCPCHLLFFPHRHIHRHIQQHHILFLHCIPDQWSIFDAENWHSSCLVNSGLGQGQKVAHLPAEMGKWPSHRLRTDGLGSSVTFGQQSISKDWTDIERNRQQTSGMLSSCISNSSAQKISPCLCSWCILVNNM